jgi:5-methylcytosine-specific restriction endonuclease McrA
MITITRVPPPAAMADLAQQVTDEIVDYLKARDEADAKAPVVAAAPGKKKPKDLELAKLVKKYSDDKLGLKGHLLAETHDKCAYCESKITHIDYGDIEHIVPKAVRPDLAVALTNLTVACGVCNTNKSDYYSAKAPLVDPHVDDCRKEIVFFGWGIAQAFCGPRGQHTLRELDLNRQPLSDRREKHFNSLGERISSWQKELDPDVRYALLLTIWEHAEPDAEYSSMSRTAIEYLKVDPLA